MGALKLISTQTADEDSHITFSGLDSTYDVHIVRAINHNPVGSDGANLSWDASIDNGSNWGVAATTSYIYARHSEDDIYTAFDKTGSLQDSTNPISWGWSLETQTSNTSSGELILFGFASTTYVKHFTSRLSAMQVGYAYDMLHAGFINDADDNIDAIRIRIDSLANFDGTFSLYGVSKT